MFNFCVCGVTTHICVVLWRLLLVYSSSNNFCNSRFVSPPAKAWVWPFPACLAGCLGRSRWGYWWVKIEMQCFDVFWNHFLFPVGLDAAGKTTILYKLKLGEIVTTIPTIGRRYFTTILIVMLLLLAWTKLIFRFQRGDCGIQEHLLYSLGRGWSGQD